MMPASERQITAYLVAVAYRSMASRGVETVDQDAITAILEDRTTNEAQKSAAIQHLLASQG